MAMLKMYVVTRRCCLGSTCGRHAPFKFLRVQQLRTLNLANAERCQKIFDQAGYQARMFEADIADESEVQNYAAPVEE